MYKLKHILASPQSLKSHQINTKISTREPQIPVNNSAMFEVEFRQQQQSDAGSHRCRKIVLAIWIPVVVIITILFIFISHVMASLFTFVILLVMFSFTPYYCSSAWPGTTQVEVRHTDQTGLSPSKIKEIPTFSYQHKSHDDHCLNNGNGSDTSGLRCAVCIVTVHDGDIVRQLLLCKHVFHTNCIDTWLSSHLTCPMCRADVKTGELPLEKPEPPV